MAMSARRFQRRRPVGHQRHTDDRRASGAADHLHDHAAALADGAGRAGAAAGRDRQPPRRRPARSYSSWPITAATDQRATGPQGPARYPDPRDLRSAPRQAPVHQGRPKPDIPGRRRGHGVARGAGVQIIGFTPQEALEVGGRLAGQPARGPVRSPRVRSGARAAAARLWSRRSGGRPLSFASRRFRPRSRGTIRALQRLSASPCPPRAAATAACRCPCCSTR